MINNVLTIVRKDLNLNKKEFANELGITGSAIGHYESGRRKCPKAVYKFIADKWGYSLDWLLTGDGPKYEDDNKDIEFINDLVKSYNTMTNERKIAFKAFCESFGIIDSKADKNVLGEKTSVKKEVM